MAIMIPDSCPEAPPRARSGSTPCSATPCPTTSPPGTSRSSQGRYPDFTLLADDFGLLVLEVKGWYAGQIARATDHEVELHRTEGGEERVERHKNPIRQVREYLFGLMDELARPEYAILRQAEGEHRGKPCFPCGYGVLLTNITRAQLDEAGLSAVFPPERVICRDELAALEGAGDREVIRRLKQLFPAYFPFDPLTEDQLKTLKGVLHREVVVKRRPATAASVPEGQGCCPGAVALEVLDAQQEQAARSLGSGHHVVFGVAGSGKTVLLLARARLIAAAGPAQEGPGRSATTRPWPPTWRPSSPTTRPAATSRSATSTPGPPARPACASATTRRSTPTRRGWSAPCSRGLGQFAEAEKYDAILIDEGHDFEPDWFRCAVGDAPGRARGGPADRRRRGPEPLRPRPRLHLEVGRRAGGGGRGG